jgi:hypothetical protein
MERIVVVLGLIVLTGIPAASAREPGAGDNFDPGSSVNIPIGSIPPPGISMINYFPSTWGQEVNASGHNAGYDVSSSAYVMQLWWNPGVKFLGADYGAFVLQPLADRAGPVCLNRISASISGSLPWLGCQAEWQRVEVGLIRGAVVKARMWTLAVVEVEIPANRTSCFADGFVGS